MIAILGALPQSRENARLAEACRRHARAAMEGQIEATARAEVARHYMFALHPPPIEKRGGIWFAIIESGPSTPIVEKRQ